MKNTIPTLGRDEPNEPDPEFVKQKDYDAKVLEIENALKEKITIKDIPPFPEIPEIPDHSIYLQEHDLEPYAKKEEIPKPIDISNLVKKEEIEKFATKDQLPDLTPYLKKSELPTEKDLSEYAKKEDLPDLKPYIKKENLPDFNTLATKAELELKASIGDMAKKVSIEDMEKYKSAIDESLKSKLNKSEAYTRQEVKDRYIKKEVHQKDLQKKMDKIALPDFEQYAKKTDIEGLIDKECVDLSEYAKKSQLNDYLLKKDIPKPQDLSEYAKKSDLNSQTETSYCMVKLQQDFRPYDGDDWEFEFYMGSRGIWWVRDDTHKALNKPDEYVYWTPFAGIFFIDFSFTCRRDTHLLKPHTLQRIRTSEGEFINWQYFDNPSAIPTGNDVSVRTFRDRCEILMPKGGWIRFSMQLTNRANNSKRKTWIHGVGSEGGYSPTYFSITGIKKEI